LIWPDNFKRFIIDSINNEQDKKIAEISISYAERYIATNKDKKIFEPRTLVLEYLLFQAQFNNSHSYIYSNELIDWLKQNKIYLTEEEFRKEVIGHLRDEGVVIAGSRKGLKIPLSASELIDYLNYTSSRYLTIIRRFKETYNTLNATSLGKIGIFETSEFEIHKEIFKVLEKY
jgi:arsenate reductase-like glutaredoxin family protein